MRRITRSPYPAAISTLSLGSTPPARMNSIIASTLKRGTRRARPKRCSLHDCYSLIAYYAYVKIYLLSFFSSIDRDYAGSFTGQALENDVFNANLLHLFLELGPDTVMLLHHRIYKGLGMMIINKTDSASTPSRASQSAPISSVLPCQFSDVVDFRTRTFIEVPTRGLAFIYELAKQHKFVLVSES